MGRRFQKKPLQIVARTLEEVLSRTSSRYLKEVAKESLFVLKSPEFANEYLSDEALDRELTFEQRH